MKTPIFVTGNTHKVEALKYWLGYELPHKAIDIEELQELDSELVVRHKAIEAFAIIKKPVLIEDVSLVYNALGRLPGTFVKWFIGEMTLESGCRLLDGFADKTAVAQVTYAYYDGSKMHIFEGRVNGVIADHPKGTNGHGWDPIFKPEGSKKTYAEMEGEEIKKFSVRQKAVIELKVFLDSAVDSHRSGSLRG